ncbi:hypothetical protein N7462_002047 [Penicillium macrosclerotiorum]|uniref:uncharacterized protein n=1 Tax=Penicillium macrosclerotiorum TaxID=303699 RepID=UPI002546E733|nr:uncharacterized protein N7462_002047 [Penicillium macrosclerotiorum]KAJ5692624.1 hypothetical protein N7462_002047 [Penicillium macrosclerotiorum]
MSFTFSAHSSLSGVRTPSSSSWDERDTPPASNGHSPSVPRSLVRTSPPPISRFQGLNIANQIKPATASGTSQRDASQLTPSRSTSTYADQHNASPSPAPSRVTASRINQSQDRQSSTSSRPTLFFAAHEGRAKSLASEPRTENIQVPGAYPESLHSPDEIIRPVPKVRGKGKQNSIREEPLPKVPIYDSRLQIQLKELKGSLANLATSIRSSALVHDQSSSLYSHYQRVQKASKFVYPESRTVGFIGDSGVGKSSLINSLLDQGGLSRSSSDGAACTCVVTEFRHTDDAHTGPFTVEAEFMTTVEMKELLEELLLNFRQFYVSSAYRELQGEEARRQCRDAAERAWETFQSLFRSQPRLTMDFLSEDKDGAYEAILYELERWAYAGLTHRPGGNDALDYSAIAGDLRECKELLDMLTADHQEGDAAYAEDTRVYLNSPVLRTGLVLADLPGFRDLNFAREVSAEEVARVKDSDGRRVKQMNQDIEMIRNSIEETEIARQNADERQKADFALRESRLRDREKRLNFEVTQFLITRRNTKISRELLRKHEDIRVFCVSNTLYTTHRASRTQQAEEYVNLTGIRELRHYCQRVPAEAQLRATSAFLNLEVPTLLLSLRQWALSGADSVTTEKARTLRELLGNVEEILRRDFTSPQGHMARIKDGLRSLYNASINQSARSYRDEWKNKSIVTSSEWASWHHSTYTAYCAHFGTHSTAQQRDRSWNDELISPTRDHLYPQWEALLEWLELQIDSSGQDTAATFQEVSRQLTPHIEIAPRALENLLRSILSRKDYINHHIEVSMKSLIAKTDLIKTDMIYGHDSSFISNLMRPAYISCQREYGTGSDRRRKNIMHNHLQCSSLFNNLSRVTLEEYRKIMMACFETLQANINQEVETIARDCHSVVTDAGHIPEAQQDPELARTLELEINRVEETLVNSQNVMEVVSKEHEHEPSS